MADSERRVARRPKPQTSSALNAGAQQMLDECVADFRADLLAEAERLEAGQRIGGAGPEITSTMVHDANSVVRRSFRKAPRSMAVTVAQLGAAGALVAVGVATNHLDRFWGQMLFAAAVCLAMVATTIALIKEGR